MQSDVAITPLVSIILATYNWPSVLDYAIRTVLWQTFTDFELLVIGDACTDNTEALVSSFGDPRIRWHNLPHNSGSQAGPNNAGLTLARGRYIAYMHQDDLWLPNHLSVLVNAMQSNDVYLAHTLGLGVGPKPIYLRRVLGLPNGGKSGPDQVAIITPNVLHRADIARQIGGWQDWKTLDKPPTYDFWRRLVGPENRFMTVQEVTVVKFHSAERRDSYIEQSCEEQARYFARIQSEPDFLYRELLCALDGQARGLKPVNVLPRKPDNAPLGWEMNVYRELRGLGSTALESQSKSTQRWSHRLGYWLQRVGNKLSRIGKQIDGS